jgi:hypothetical protein
MRLHRLCRLALQPAFGPPPRHSAASIFVSSADTLDKARKESSIDHRLHRPLWLASTNLALREPPGSWLEHAQSCPGHCLLRHPLCVFLRSVDRAFCSCSHMERGFCS